MRALASHEICATTAALTGYPHVRGQTETVGDEQEGYIIIAKKRDWRTLHT